MDLHSTAALSEEDKGLVVSFYTYAIAGMTLEWVAGGMKDEPEAMVDKLSRAARALAGRK